MSKAIVIINESHTLKQDQLNVLNEIFSTFDFLKVPSSGWNLEEIKLQSDAIVRQIHNVYHNDDSLSVVFVSPIPAMIKLVSIGLDLVDAETHVFVFHNDNRVKKELPNGKIISVVADKGWVLV